jgi:hypothetical protein
MNIHHIYWEQLRNHPDGVFAGLFELNAVVIAENHAEARKMLDLNEKDIVDVDIRVKLLGICTDGTDKPRIVCQED